MKAAGFILCLIGFTGLAISGVADAASSLDLTWAAIDSVAVVCMGLMLNKAERGPYKSGGS